MEKDLEIKIKELFKYRKLPALLKMANTSKKKEKILYNNLIKLQASIYDLDVYLESNWIIDANEIKNKWRSIYKALKDLKVPKSKQEHYVRQIIKYQSHEMNMRTGKLPTDYTMEYFYYYKSCDVKLIRQIIYDNFPSLNKVCRLADWRLFDLVTEVVDDLTDVIEDTKVYNGNRFLISSLMNGKKKTFASFDLFLNDVDSKLESEKWDKDNLQKLNIWTNRVISEADELLDDLATEFPKKLIKTSIIRKKIKK